MSIDIILVQITLGILLFFVINWIGKHSYSIGYISISVFVKAEEAPALNFIIRVLTPVVYLLIVSTILYALNLDKYVINFYFVSCYYILFRLSINLITDRGLLLNWYRQVIYWISIVALSYFVYDKLIVSKQNLFPDLTTIGNELWIIILLFIYQLFNKARFSVEGTIKRKEKYLERTMTMFQKKYGKIINAKIDSDQLKGIIYSILIIENFNRPKIVRLFEYLSFFITKKPHTMGVMQYYSTEYINSKQSVILGIEKIKNGYTKLIKQYENGTIEYYSEWNLKSQIANIYNTGTDYSDDVVTMWGKIMEKYYANTTDKLYEPENACR
jgi:hypothetical protein